MARFTALASDDSSSDEEIPQAVNSHTTKKSPQAASREPEVDRDSDENVEAVVEEEDSSSDSESSELDPDDLLRSPPRGGARRTGKNALVEDENGEIQFAHEADKEGSPGSQSSGSRSPDTEQTREKYRGNPTVIPWAQRVGVDAQKMHVMQTALFRMPEEAAALKEMNDSSRVNASRIKLDLAGKVSGVGRKHSRESDHDAMRNDSRERASFAHDIEPALYRPSRKYARVAVASSIANGQEGSYFDAGLALGRSFRVSWGPGGTLVHLGSLCGPLQKSPISSNSSVVAITQTLPSLRPPDLDPTNRRPIPAETAGKLLQHHLSHTTINRDECGIPYALPTSLSSPPPPLSHTLSAAPASSSDPLNFASFASLYPSLETTNPAPIFRLGRVLFDPLNLNLSSSRSASGSSITPNIKERVLVLRRKAALGKWLEEVVKPLVEGDLRVEVNGSNATYTPADAAFTHLTGHQISEACTTAGDGGYLKLATLISQAGGDDLFKDDIIGQIEIWKSEKLAPGSNTFGKDTGLVNRGVWKIYHLLAGLITHNESEARSADNIWIGLDWKRVFGICLWYGTSLDQSVADAVNSYERLIKQSISDASSAPKPNQVARPLPRWTQPASQTGASSLALVPARSSLFAGSSDTSSSQPEDPLYTLIKLYADPALSLSNALNPRSFSPTLMDWGIGMCWHLYIILSRVMRVRDFADRQEGVKKLKPTQSRPRASVARSNGDDDDDDVERVEGHSPTADLLASSYAFELESWGMIQEAAFVLLHLEGSVGREKAIKDLLSRSAPRLDDWVSSGLVGSLKLPATWIDEAKAMYQLDCGNIYTAYELYLTAQLYNAAHNIALHDLAPDAIIRKDLELLRSLFAPFDIDGRRDKVESWFVRGKIYLDYVNIMIRLPKLLDEVAAEQEDRETILDATQADEIDELTKRIPKILALLPDILHRDRAVDDRHVAALEEMSKDLLKLLERSKPLLLSQIQQPTLNMLDGAAKINLVKGVGLARFLQAIEA